MQINFSAPCPGLVEFEDCYTIVSLSKYFNHDCSICKRTTHVWDVVGLSWTCSGDYSLVESFPGVSNLGWNCSGINIYVTSACKILTQRVVATRLDQCRRAIFTALNICTTLDQTLRIMIRVVVSNVSPIVHEWWSWFINIKTKAKEKTYLARDASLSD